jgi:hypothetical protein
MTSTNAYIARETLVSVVINTVLSLLFFRLVFASGQPVPVWGVGAFVFEFGPQAFLIALMATLVPGALAGRALRAGRVAAWTGRSILPAALGRRAVLMALVSAGLAVAVAGGVLGAAGLASLPYAQALAVKLAFGAGLAVVVTPLGLRAALAL